MSPRQEEITTVSTERALREKATAEYGSWENKQAKAALGRYPQEFIDAYTAALKTAITEDELIETLEHRVPWWMSPFLLSRLDLALLGAPEGSDEWRDAKNKERFRMRRKDAKRNAFYCDYTDMGWPKSAGKPVRWVTPEEHREIVHRLSKGALTLPGAEVATVGKTLAQMLEEAPAEPGWLIEGLLRRGGSAMVYGPPGVGKTFLTNTLMFLAAAGGGAGVIHTGTDRWVLKAGDHAGARVCLVDGEMIEADVVARAKMLCEGLGLCMTGSVQSAPPMDLGRLRMAVTASGESPEEVEKIVSAQATPKEAEGHGFDHRDGDGPKIDLGNIVVYAKSAQDHRAQFVDLVDPAWLNVIVSYCQREKIDVLILDNLSTLTTTLEDENAAANWYPLNDLVVALKKAGVATILVHHANKAGTGYRGSSNLSTTLETVVKLEKLEGPHAKESAGFRVVLEKNRSHGQPHIDGKRLVLRDARWTVEDDALGQAQELVDKVNSMRYATQTELAEAMGVNQASISRMFRATEGLGLATVRGLKEKLADARTLRAQIEQAGPDDADGDDEPDSALDI